MQINQVFQKLWVDYTELNPSAKAIYDTFISEGEEIFNDHVAFRTIQGKLGVDHYAKIFLELGYTERDTYEFKEKKLFAKHFEHPDSKQPKVFISELKSKDFSPFLQGEMKKIEDSISDLQRNSEEFYLLKRPWKINHSTYLQLAKESEYASWVYVYGFRANHFTVNVNALKKFTDLEKLNAFVESKGFTLNASGGKIKGSPSELLEQSSTMAKQLEISFEDGKFPVPACYYEFAKRYVGADGKLYQGFIAASADKIFESTNRN